MEKYLKDKFKCFGIKKPERDILKKEFIASYGYPPAEALEELVLLLWQYPEREMHYFALVLLHSSGRNLIKIL